jgi:copper homeostasis protein
VQEIKPGLLLMKLLLIDMKLEICANSYKSAINAQKAGAHRMELCTELSVGGLTPTYGLLKKVIDTISIPVYVLIRPRSGNFTYSNSEINIMKYNIQLCKDLGYTGIVSGVLNKDNTINIEHTKELIGLAKPLPLVFHRAFDWTPNATQALEQLIDLGVERILTSGLETSAIKGINLLEELKKVAKGRITIMPGGGINADNASIFKNAGFEEIHTSASTIKQVNDIPKIEMHNHKLFDETIEAYSDIDNIKSILNIINE